MDIKFSSEGTTLKAFFTGELDHHGARNAREKTDIMLNMGVYNRLVLDFTGLTFMDSSGISLIMGRVKLLEALGGKVKVISPGERISRIIKMCGVDKYAELEERKV